MNDQLNWTRSRRRAKKHTLSAHICQDTAEVAKAGVRPEPRHVWKFPDGATTASPASNRTDRILLGVCELIESPPNRCWAGGTGGDWPFLTPAVPVLSGSLRSDWPCPDLDLGRPKKRRIPCPWA
ncbi:hypothetical protein SKAU_G00333440 [Synaphobranchus kaupii]|uniref:Uncharacterized protein n=1 Tax=Synaphobranchus kaupii TaxID=118154 RepID=A0A9Q1IGJ1_SYNKA|nr:hypothetical protein SKAU_G00333440 [Synaphobranchus kaupii]